MKRFLQRLERIVNWLPVAHRRHDRSVVTYGIVVGTSVAAVLLELVVALVAIEVLDGRTGFCQ